MTITVYSLAELVERGRSLAAGPRRVLGIAGAPGGGKSTIAEAVVAALGDRAVLVPMDGFHLAQVQLERLDRAHRKGAPDTFDADGFAALLRRLREPDGTTVYAPAFRREIEEPVAGAVAVPPEVPLVVTEGNYLLLQDGPWAQVRGLLDESWLVRGDEVVRLERLIARHVRFGRTPEQARDWVMRSDEANAALIADRSAPPDVLVDVRDISLPPPR